MNETPYIVKIRQACTLIAGLLWFMGLIVAITPAPPAWSTGLFGLALGLSAVRMMKPVWESLRTLSLDMNLLMTAAVVGAIVLQEWAEGALILWLFALADWIEDKSMARTTRAIESLMQLAPDRVRLITPQGEVMVSPEEVGPGSRIRLQPGERVGLDAKVVSGTSQIMQAQVTGESMPVEVAQGDTVYAGSMNGNGLLELETIRSAGESTVARIIKLVQEARRTKAPMQKTVERFAKYYTPMVFLTALLVSVIPVLFFQQPLSVWGYRSLVILLVGCPCAFIIATPVTLVSGLTIAAHRGILVKGGAALEQASRLKAMVFDKTGTLTTGKLAVENVITLPGHTEEQVLTTAAAISGESGHILGKAIRGYCTERNLTIPKAEDIQLIPGQGAQGTLDGTTVLVGHIETFSSQAIPLEQHGIWKDLANAGHALVCVGTASKMYGCIALADTVRQEAPKALADLKYLGVNHLALLSGDHQDAVRKLTDELPLDVARGECVPADKLQDIHSIQHKYGLTAMIGDGINDAPALAGADLGIAMGAGSDQALETADVALITDDLAALPLLIRIARKTTQRVKLNIALALILKFGFLAIATTGFASLWMAVLADTGSSLIVIACGLNLLREKIE